jgi:hypothetical protein
LIAGLLVVKKRIKNLEMACPTPITWMNCGGSRSDSKGRYIRNNKAGGIKNLRCHPQCANGVHNAHDGPCGGPVEVLVEVSSAAMSEKKLPHSPKFAPPQLKIASTKGAPL